MGDHMLNKPKTKVFSIEGESVYAMPSTKSGSAIVNNFTLLAILSVLIWAVYLYAAAIAIFYSWGMALSIIAITFLISRLFDFWVRGTKRRKGYISVTPSQAKDLIKLEKLYAELPKEDRNVYRSYLEGAFYGDATPEKVTKLFQQKLQENAAKPKVFDKLIDDELELP
jgi:hypothetical protein